MSCNRLNIHWGTLPTGVVLFSAVLLSACTRGMPWSSGYKGLADGKVTAPSKPNDKPAVQPPKPSPTPVATTPVAPSPNTSPVPTLASEAALKAECPIGSYSTVIKRFPDGRAAEDGCYAESPDGSIGPAGTWVSRHPNGSLSAVKRFKQGVPHGIWKRWDASGKGNCRVQFENGIPIKNAQLRRSQDDTFTFTFDGATADLPSVLVWRSGPLRLTLKHASKTNFVEFVRLETSPEGHPSDRILETFFSNQNDGENNTLVAGSPPDFFLNLNDEWLTRFARDAKGFGTPIDPQLSDAKLAGLLRKMIQEGALAPEAEEVTEGFRTFLITTASQELLTSRQSDPNDPTEIIDPAAVRDETREQ